MAHNIHFNERTGKHSFFSVQQKAWHGLGQIVEQYPTSEEAIKHAGLDYEVVESPLFTKGSGIIETSGGIEIGSSELEVPNYFANIRTDNNAVLGVVGIESNYRRIKTDILHIVERELERIKNDPDLQHLVQQD